MRIFRSTQRRTILLPLLALLALVTTVVPSGCEKSPEPGHLDNPFDPNGDLGGDALQVQAIATTNLVSLSWNQPQGYDIVEYEIFRTDDLADGFRDIAVNPATAASIGTYQDRFPPASRQLWYQVRAVTSAGVVSLISNATPATAVTGPHVVVGDSLTSLASRFTDLSITAGFGDTILVATDSTFAGALALPVSDPDLPQVTTYDFGAADDSTRFDLFVKAVGGGAESEVTKVEIGVGFAPTVGLVTGTPLRLARRIVDLKIPADGVVQMRFAPSEAALASAAWVPGAAVYPGYELADSANPQEIWGEFEGDFGFNVIDSQAVRPDLLASAVFRLKLPPSSRVVSRLTVVGEHSAGATEMRVSENPNFAAVPWVAYADTASFQLSPGEGTKTVYAQYRNDWTESTILSDYCVYVSQGIEVQMVAPTSGNVLEGGSTLLVKGTANPGTVATAIDSVRLDLGDGLGFREVVGTDNWQLTWNVPRFAADTPLAIRARAWAHSATESYVVTDAVTVTVSQLAVTILDPPDGASRSGGASVNIAGTATPFLAGAAVDSVVIDANGDRLLASGTATWTASWAAPTVAVDTPAVITATAWADGETASSTITITLTP